MKGQIEGQLTLFPEEHHVSRSVSPGSDEARQMTVTSGLKCSASLKNSDPLGSFSKMCLGSSIWHSTRCFLTWKTKDLPHNRLLFRLVASMPRTKGKESVLWPTPSTGAALCGGTGNFKTLQRMADVGIITEEERRQLAQGNGGKTNPALLEWLMGYEQEFTKLIPTPIASDSKGTCLNRYWLPACSQFVHVEREREADERLRLHLEKFPRGKSVWEAWPDEPGIPRVCDGLPNRIHRIRCLGNAVVPQQFYPFFAAIAAIEREGD